MTAGQSPPSSPRGFSGFCFAPSERVQEVQKSQQIFGPWMACGLLDFLSHYGRSL